MYNTGQTTTLARLRPEKLDDAAIRTQITLIQQKCEDVDADRIALVFHECDYNIQNTIARLQAGGLEDGGWQTAKSNNKKKSNHQANSNELLTNGNLPSDDTERPLPQHVSPTTSFRGGNGAYRRQEHNQYPSSSRGHPIRRGNGSGHNPYVPSNTRYPPRHQSTTQKSTLSPLTVQETPSESMVSVEPSNEQRTPTTTTSSSTDEFEFLAGTTQSLTFDNSLKKISLPTLPTSTAKRPAPSSIPQQPVAMHPTVQFSTAPIDIQFGDVQWNDSMPSTVSPSKTTAAGHTLNEPASSIVIVPIQEQASSAQEYLSSDYDQHPATKLLSSTSLSSSLPIANHPLTNNATVPLLDGTSHLADHLNDLSQQQQQTSASNVLSSSFHTDPVHVPATSTPHTTEHPSPISHSVNPLVSNSLQSSLSGANYASNETPSAFIPYTPAGSYPTMPREYPQQASAWSPVATSNYKTIPAPSMTQLGAYPPQASYPLQAQQQYVLGNYPYPAPAVYQIITPEWSSGGFPSAIDPYASYPNYIPAFPNTQQYHGAAVQATKYGQYSTYDKEFIGHYGQTRSTTNELVNSSQTPKDPSSTSKLSATAATFSQGAPLSANNPTGAFYFNPVSFSVPTYVASHQDRTISYPSIDSRDNRNGALYGGQNNRAYYHHQQHHQGQQQQQQQQQQQRHHQNSTWHAQQ